MSSTAADRTSRIEIVLDLIEVFAFAEAVTATQALAEASPQDPGLAALLAHLDQQLKTPEASVRIDAAQLGWHPPTAPLRDVDQLLERNPSDPLALSVKACDLAARGDRAGALSLCAAGLQRAPNDYSLNMQMAALEQDSQPNAARMRWREMSRQYPRRARPWYLLGRDHGIERAERIAAVWRAADVSINDGLTQYNCGTELYQLGANDEAVTLLRRARDLLGPSNSIQHNLACALKAAGASHEALDEWQDLLKREPDWSWIVASVAELLASFERYDEAWRHWQHYQHIADPSCEYYNAYLKHLWSYDKFEALRAASQARLGKQRDATTFKYLGLAHDGLGQHQAALDALQQAQTIGPDPINLALMAKVLNDLRRYQLAQQMAEEVLAEDPKSGRALCEKAVALFSQQRDTEAETLLNSYRGNMRFINLRCAEAMAAQRRWELAGRLYERQLAVTPNVARTASLAGDCYRDAGHRKQASTMYQRASLLAAAEGSAELEAHARTQHQALGRRGLLGWLPFRN